MRFTMMVRWPRSGKLGPEAKQVIGGYAIALKGLSC